jgi:hypothetical protein
MRGAIVALAILAAANHVCELPAHAGWEAAATSATPTHSHDDEHPTQPGIHAESCEAVSTSAYMLAPLVVIATPLELPLADAPGACPGPIASTAVSSPSPPLFLLHAALLI